MSALCYKDTAELDGSAVTSVGLAAAEIVAASGGRDTLIIQNTHATQTMRIVLDRTAANGGTNATATTGLLIAANGGSLTLEGYRGYVNAIASGATTTYTVVTF